MSEVGSQMTQKLDTDREIVTLNGRPLTLKNRTVDGRLILETKAGAIVMTDHQGCLDSGKVYAVNREGIKFRPGPPRVQPLLKSGQTVYAFRFSKRQPCLLPAIFVGLVNGACKVVPVTPIAGREVLKIARSQIFDDVDELLQWIARLNSEMALLRGATPQG
jgi:hypothetical protein